MGDKWFDVSSLVLKDGTFYRGYENDKKNKGIDFNFCRAMYKSSNSYCEEDCYAGHWNNQVCDAKLSGPTQEPEEVISASEIFDRDEENVIGVTLKYSGGDDGKYVLLDLNCDHGTDFWWDETYMVHRDTHGTTYYQMIINTKAGCVVIETQRFFFYLGTL